MSDQNLVYTYSYLYSKKISILSHVYTLPSMELSLVRWSRQITTRGAANKEV
jgi:hypothetical protein